MKKQSKKKVHVKPIMATPGLCKEDFDAVVKEALRVPTKESIEHLERISKICRSITRSK